MNQMLKRTIIKSEAFFGLVFAGLGTFALLTKGDSQYANEPDQKNPMEGKKVVFVENSNEKENADGYRGHLEPVGDATPNNGFYETYGKRILDIILSFGGLVVLSPILFGTALAIKIDDPGPVLFTQKRMGKNKRYFRFHKFRSMKMSTPHDVPTHMLDNPEQYITRVGKFLRAHSLDELPQIWDIFIGNMSVIGPRPALWNQDVLTAEREKYNVNEIKPGLTGWAQINGRDELNLFEKARLDGEYAERQSLLFDIRCFLNSLHVFRKDESVIEGGTGNMEKCQKANIALIKNTPFSVLMSVYHKEDPSFFDSALESILTNQTVKPTEFVLVCDGPLSKELDVVVDKYVHRYPETMRVFRLTKNQGLGKALNYGLSKCTNSFVARADSDDICVNKRFEIQLDYLLNHPEVSIVSSDIDEFNTDWNQPINSKIMPTSHEKIVQMAKSRNPINHMAVMFRKEVIDKIGSYRQIPYIEDYELWVRAITNGVKLGNINKVLVHARIGNGMIARRGNKQYINSWTELNRYMKSKGMINNLVYLRNCVGIRAFVYMPNELRELAYRMLLRKK